MIVNLLEDSWWSRYLDTCVRACLRIFALLPLVLSVGRHEGI